MHHAVASNRTIPSRRRRKRPRGVRREGRLEGGAIIYGKDRVVRRTNAGLRVRESLPQVQTCVELVYRVEAEKLSKNEGARIRRTYWSLVLECEGDLVGRDGAFAEDHPGVAAAGEVDDGGGEGAGGGAAVDDKGKFVSELFADAEGGGALGAAGEIGGGGGNGQAELLDDGAGDGGLGNAKGEVAGIGGDAEGEFGAGFDDDGEGAGPEFLGEA